MRQQQAAVKSHFFNGFIDHLESDVLVADAGGVIQAVNTRFLESWGGTREQYYGASCFQLNDQEKHGENRRTLFEQAVMTGNKVHEEVTSPNSDGAVRNYSVTAMPVHDELGVIRHVVLMREDMTEKRRLEQQLAESQRLAAIGELSAYIAHEIRNPLFAIGGFARKLLNNPDLSEQLKDVARVILEEAQRLEATCKNVTSFAQPTVCSQSGVDVNSIAVRTVLLLSMGNENSNIQFTLEPSQQVPMAHGSVDLIQQALINVVKNAMEAVGKAGTIQVRTRFAEATVYLEVEDDGPGIPADMQDKVFNPFFSTKEAGTGLGLAMTRKLINECNGRIFLHSKSGGPTIVSMALQPFLAESGTSE
ncbi:PAS/PAC sensor signal transduction histidine kinase (fragment) [uncultured delta proteobacterium]|uniref:histidine kinase n=1 Tax=uncultured delta proteobacterium TaxID=34034 RepID=A0A212JNN9_9DELT